MAETARSNLRKHTHANPLQRWLIGRFHRRIADLVAEIEPDNQGRPALDLGCGEGFTLAALANRQAALRWHACDYEPSALHWARRQHAAVFCAADAARLPYRSQAFGLVLCLEVLEHLVKPELALAEIGRVGERAVISVPHQPYFASANFLRGKNWRTRGDDPEHVQWWTANSFADFIRTKLTLDRLEFSFPWVIAVARSCVP